VAYAPVAPALWPIARPWVSRVSHAGQRCRCDRATWLSWAPLQRKGTGGWLSAWVGCISFMLVLVTRMDRAASRPSTGYMDVRSISPSRRLQPQTRTCQHHRLAEPMSCSTRRPYQSPVAGLYSTSTNTASGLRGVKNNWCSNRRATSDKGVASQGMN